MAAEKIIAKAKSKTTKSTEHSVSEVEIEPYIDDDGYIQCANFKKKTVSSLEKGTMIKLHAIVLHRTESSSSSSALTSFKNGVGTHFLVDKDGTVYQCASLLKYTYHIGKIKSRCKEEKSCTTEEQKTIDGFGWAPKKIHNHEKQKKYPARYPINDDSVGIEVVGAYNEANKTWDTVTNAQKESISFIIEILKENYKLEDKDIYEHDKISYKTAGEGGGLYSPNAHS